MLYIGCLCKVVKSVKFLQQQHWTKINKTTACHTSLQAVETNMQTLKLTYFEARGRAETARLILAYGGLDYEDRRFPIGAKEFKPSAPYGQESLFICLWTSSDFLDSKEFFKGYRLKEPLKRQKKRREKN